MATLDMGALTIAQQDVLGNIAIGLDGGHPPRVLEFLRGEGLIVEHRQRLAGHPPVVVSRWEVPLDVHMQWAAWCAENCPDDDAPVADDLA